MKLTGTEAADYDGNLRGAEVYDGPTLVGTILATSRESVCVLWADSSKSWIPTERLGGYSVHL